MDKKNSELKLKFLHPHGPASSFTYPTSSDIANIHSSDILLKGNPSTQTGRTYYITSKEAEEASTKLKTRNEGKNN